MQGFSFHGWDKKGRKRLVLLFLTLIIFISNVSLGAERTKTVVLICNPKIIKDFNHPDLSIKNFFEHYDVLFEKAEKVILILGIGNSEHILQYRGRKYWEDKVQWARYIGPRLSEDNAMSKQFLDYNQIYEIVKKFKYEASIRGYNFKIFDMINSTYEFAWTSFRTVRHRETMKNSFTYNIMVSLNRDDYIYATNPDGISEGKNAGEFLAEQTAVYIKDLGFDGVLYKNQLGTRARWNPQDGPGYTKKESKEILNFLRYTKELLGNKELMWFDSYDTIEIERKYYSFPEQGYKYFDYIIVSGFCVITDIERYIKNLKSKLTLSNVTKLLATLDYVDPWYKYDSMNKFPVESKNLEDIAIKYFDRINGIVMFGNDEYGNFIPREIIKSFSERFFKSNK